MPKGTAWLGVVLATFRCMANRCELQVLGNDIRSASTCQRPAAASLQLEMPMAKLTVARTCRGAICEPLSEAHLPQIEYRVGNF